MSLTALIFCAFSTTSFAKTREYDKSDDGFFYAHVFHLVVAFDKEGDDWTNHFKNQTATTNERFQILKSISYDFVNIFKVFAGQKQLLLAREYRDKLKRQFGISEFERFDLLVRKKFGGGTDNCPASGYPQCSSSINLDGSSILRGSASTVFVNSPNRIYLKGVPSGSRKNVQGKSFTVYDDDDYNEDDTLDNGDSSEQIVPLPESFKYLSVEDGNYPDGKPKNVYAGAYIMPEYNWAQSVVNYNQTNLPFVLNVPENSIGLDLNANRNSATHETDGFWIAYLLVAYQGADDSDADGEAAAVLGTGPPTSVTNLCDCYQSATCVGTICSVPPKGVSGSFIFQEVMQDATRSFLRDAGMSIESKGTTGPHELGHQLGLNGDNRDPITNLSTRTVATYKIMDYPHRPTETDDYFLHPEHINILRRRIKSPGE